MQSTVKTFRADHELVQELNKARRALKIGEGEFIRKALWKQIKDTARQARKGANNGAERTAPTTAP